MNYPGRGSPRSPEHNGRGGGGGAWELGSDARPAFGGGVCCFEHLPGGDPDDGDVPLALLRGEPGLHLAPGTDDHNHHLALDPCLSDENYDFSSAESGSSLRYYSEGESGGGGSSLSLHPPQQPPLVPTNSGGGGATGGSPGERKRTRLGGPAARHRYEVVTELGPEEVRWFYKEDKKTWKPFIGYDSLRIELAFRTLLQTTGARPQGGDRDGDHVCSPTGPASSSGEDDDEDRACGFCQSTTGHEPEMVELVNIEPVCVRGGLYEVDVTQGECYPVYWNQADKIPVMRGQWFIDGTWQPLEEEESNLIEQEHLNCFRGQQMQENFDIEVSKSIDGKDASSSGTRLHRGYVEEATLEDKPSQTTHIVFVVHGIGQKMDQGRIIKNTAMMREAARKIEERHFSNHATHVEFLPVEWRSKLTLDGDTVDSITPDKVRGLRDMLNSSAMDIMYYTSPLYRDELVKGLQQELNRLYSLFCSRNPDFEEKGGKVSIVSHSLGCVITYDIMTGWNPVRLYEQLLQKEEELPDERWMSYEERHLLDELYITKRRLKEIEERLHGLKASSMTQTPALKFKVENFFCMGSPLAVFLALRGIRPGNTGSQDHILPREICNRLLNIFHPTDPVAYRLEPLILKHYSNISPVQIHWYNTSNPLPYEHMKPSFLNPAKEPTSVSENEGISTIPSPVTSPVLSRRHYGESITNIGKASILGAASIGKGLGGMLFSRFGRSSTTQSSETSKDSMEDEKKPVASPSATTVGTQTLPHSSSGFLDSAYFRLQESFFNLPQLLFPENVMQNKDNALVELDHRIDFELREGLVESRYWSAVTSHTAYWSSLDVALFLLTFMYKHEHDDDAKPNLDPI
ncbi:phospholipase DDHD1 isoform X6 [Homo sapiens]|uniref:phospholipase DDHD1 isoform X6 n=1 Tax=Homo sapiens TaxID=9606 RepID=UPI000387DEA2|nr:phospholipase DDHD1 isoform X6 [Homo sapiens]XP_054232739.1 phospholipase DDHD1 isoform X6 [Homo sapiens]|eukprot:XP_005268162.1 phospholipase DDHD1 isoform X6 [Homo sapiens]